MSWDEKHWDEKYNPTPAYGGAAVRIRVYYTSDVRGDLWLSLSTEGLIDFAREVLAKYTLSLDIEGEGIQGEGRPLYTLDFDRPMWPPVVNGMPWFEEVHRQIKRGVDWIPGKQRGQSAPAENRLIVVFARLDTPSGQTICEGSWLPWVVVDPTMWRWGFKNTLIHEIGHACRLGHYDNSLMEEGGDGESQSFWRWQVREIHRSWWCTGRERPKDWWFGKPRGRNNVPFCWPPNYEPTP